MKIIPGFFSGLGSKFQVLVPNSRFFGPFYHFPGFPGPPSHHAYVPTHKDTHAYTPTHEGTYKNIHNHIQPPPYHTAHHYPFTQHIDTLMLTK